MIDKTLGKGVDNVLVLKGSRINPLLAPRGVHISNSSLFVSDTGRNRVFIWYQIPNMAYQEPDIILGQSDIDQTSRNANSDCSSKTLQYPSGIWSDGLKLIVADAWNHRVLIWHSMPTVNNQAADIVVGQQHFGSNAQNIGGVGAEPSSRSLHWPYGVWSDGKRLWIADTGNRRILYFEQIPTANFQAADLVIGKPDFETRDYESQDPIWPYSVKVDHHGHMIVADTQFYRNLLWKHNSWQSNQKADFIVGQADFDGCGQNQFGLFPSRHSLNWTYDALFYKNGIITCDTGNSRILYFKNLPDANNPPADMVIGKLDFQTGSENKDTILGTESSLYWPFSLAISLNQLVIADTGNHRVIIARLNF